MDSLKYLLLSLLCCFVSSRQVLTDRLATPEECSRPCIEGQLPKTCYYSFMLERYSTLGGACQDCIIDEHNTTCSNPQCIIGDGVERLVFSVNRKVPGPEIQVCKGDKIVVDVKNGIYGSGLTIHWHGIQQRGTQYSDGVPFLTQCPIDNGNTFRYIWNAAAAGTFFWHSHSGLHKMNGLYGILVIREPQSEDVHGDLYDYDLPEHVIFLSDHFHEDTSEHFPGKITGLVGQMPASFLINGLGQYQDSETESLTNTPLTKYIVSPNKRYRFRLINSMAGNCPVSLTIEGHPLLAISTDGEDFKPVEVDSIISLSGERYDFIIEANQTAGSYWLQLRGLGSCWAGKIQQLAILEYEGSNLKLDAKPSRDDGLPLGTILNPLNSDCGSNVSNICIDQLVFARTVDQDVMKDTPDLKITLPYKFLYYDPSELFVKDRYNLYLVTGAGKYMASLIDGISFKSPPSPPLSQAADIPPEYICNGENLPEGCQNNCTCTHVYNAPLNGIVEVLLVDEVAGINVSHPFHLHGQPFYVVASGRNPSWKKISKDQVKNLDSKGLITRNLIDPPKKDTITVPNNGYVVVRFKADNPGYWIFHCHFMFHVAIGMAFVINVGEPTDLPPVPENFPKCGDFLPPYDL